MRSQRVNNKIEIIFNYLGICTLFLIHFFHPLKVYSLDEKFPLMRFYLESDASYSIDYHQKAMSSCKVDIEQVEVNDNENTTKKRFNEIKKWCEQDTTFYQLKKLQFSGCNWENKVPESPIRGLGPLVEQMKKEFTIKNLEVSLKKQVLFCRGELVIPGVKKTVTLEGLCAPVDSSKVSTQGLSDFNKNPIVSFLKATNISNPLQASIDSSLKIRNEKLALKIALAIPVPWKVSQDISYLLSAQGLKKCESLKSKRKISSR